MGFAALVLACVFTGIWISSYLRIGMGQTGWLFELGHFGVGIGASNGHLEWFDVTEKEAEVSRKETVTTASEDGANQGLPEDDSSLKSSLDPQTSKNVATLVSIHVVCNIRWCIPIWSIVAPLTLISVYLLLGKPLRPDNVELTNPPSKTSVL